VKSICFLAQRIRTWWHGATPRGFRLSVGSALRVASICGLLVLPELDPAAHAENAPAASVANPPPSRVIAIGPSAAEVICALGACDAIVGVDRFTNYPPELGNRSRIGGLFDPDLERIATMHPDLNVLRGRNDSIEKLASSLGVPVYLDQTDSIPGVERVLVLGRRELHGPPEHLAGDHAVGAQ
jgi:iron complex transport system substrate-binding protein